MKKTIAVISAAVMVLSLAACSNGGGTDNSKKTENAAGKTTQAAAGNETEAPAGNETQAAEAAGGAEVQTEEAVAEKKNYPAKEDYYIIPYDEVLQTDEYYYYVWEDGTAIIDGYRGEAESLVLPEEIEGHKVTAINHKAFRSASDTKEITIPANITKIYGNPFEENRSVEKVTVGEGNTAFTVTDGCLIRQEDMALISALPYVESTLNIPEGVKVIGDWSFADNYNCNTVIMPDSVEKVDDHAFIRSGVSSVTFSKNLKSIGQYGFAYCVFGELNFPESLTSIGEMAFSGNYVEKLALPAALESLGKAAFDNSPKLTEITLPASLKSMDGNPFCSCPALTGITIAPENTVLELSGTCLVDKEAQALICSLPSAEVTEIIVPDGILHISEKAFMGQGQLTKVKLPEGIKTIGDYAFYGCGSLTAINLPEGLTAIGNDAFSDNESLTELVIPASLESLGGNAFYSCSKITSVNIPGAVKEIGRNTFNYCSALTTVTIGEGVTLIAANAFNDCGALTSVSLPETVTTIKDSAFRYCSVLKDINLPESLTDIHYSAFEHCDAIDAAVKSGSYAEEYCKSNKINYHTN